MGHWVEEIMAWKVKGWKGVFRAYKTFVSFATILQNIERTQRKQKSVSVGYTNIQLLSWNDSKNDLVFQLFREGQRD